MRRVAIGAVVLLGLVGGAIRTGAADSARAATTVVSFSVASDGVVGSGLMETTGPPDPYNESYKVKPATIKSGALPVISLKRGVFGQNEFRVSVVGGRWYPLGAGGSHGELLRLRVTVTSSSDADCPKGAQGTIGLVKSLDDTTVDVELCGETETFHHMNASRAQLSIDELRCPQALGVRPGCASLAAKEPTKLTLTVNGWNLTATKAKPAVYLHHELDQPLASETQLSIRVSIDHPLPKGWKLTVYHNGDVLSQGNGVWYKVCEVVGPSAATSCGDTRPGRVGPFDDSVWAAVSAPTYLAMHSDIYLRFNKPG